jgi:hypothetical protein
MEPRLRKGTIERFWKHVDKLDKSSCWNWAGSKTKAGYGRLYTSSPNKWQYARRIVYELIFGEIGEGLEVCHHCDNPACVNPDHLFLGTHKDNIHDAVAKGRMGDGSGMLKRKPNKGDHHRRLTADDVISIRRDFAEVGRRKLAQRHGITPQMVGLIVNRVCWKDA